MIVLNVTYKCRPGMREAFLEAIRAEGIDEASRAEAGNLKYDYYLPFGGGDELLLVEKWQDADALAAHGRQPHFLRLGALKAEYVNETVIEKFVLPE
ncbi:MAG: antibiotic biosynthesis monooxygenase [Clostridia bacterium]|jgi:quinol monooxygenase YgiN|nr:antibiotic biosynthesis monooxygenase [Clostridia bacterium]